MTTCGFCVRDAKDPCPVAHAHKHYDQSGNGSWIRGEADDYGIHVQSNGQPKIRARCLACHRTSSDIPSHVAKTWGITDGNLGWVTANEPDARDQCYVADCSADGVEIHHFAPRNTFGPDADKWPTAALCRAHHVEWHQRMDGYRWHKKGETP